MAPKDVARGRVESVENLVPGPSALVEQRPGLLQLAVNFRPGPETGPDGEHEPDAAAVVQPGDAGGGVGKTQGIPPERIPVRPVAPVLPVLHDDVERNTPLAELLRDAFELVERLVTLARLPEPEDPLGRQRCGPGELAVPPHAIGGAVAADEPIIDGIGDLGDEREPFAAVAELGRRIIVPQDAVTARRNEERIGDLLVGLEQEHRIALMVDAARLVLPQPVERFVGRSAERLLYGQTGLAADGVGNQRARVFFEQGPLRSRVEERETPRRPVVTDLQARSTEQIPILVGKAPHGDGSVGRDGNEPAGDEPCRIRPHEDAHGALGTELDAAGHAPVVETERIAVAGGAATHADEKERGEEGCPANHRNKV